MRTRKARATDDPVTPGPAAQIIGCTPEYIRRLVDRGVLPAVRGDLGVRLIDRRAVKDYARARAARLGREPQR